MGQLVFSKDLPNMVYVKDENLQGMSNSEKVYLQIYVFIQINYKPKC